MGLLNKSDLSSIIFFILSKFLNSLLLNSVCAYEFNFFLSAQGALKMKNAIPHFL